MGNVKMDYGHLRQIDIAGMCNTANMVLFFGREMKMPHHEFRLKLCTVMNGGQFPVINSEDVWK